MVGVASDAPREAGSPQGRPGALNEELAGECESGFRVSLGPKVKKRWKRVYRGDIP